LAEGVPGHGRQADRFTHARGGCRLGGGKIRPGYVHGIGRGNGWPPPSWRGSCQEWILPLRVRAHSCRSRRASCPRACQARAMPRQEPLSALGRGRGYPRFAPIPMLSGPTWRRSHVRYRWRRPSVRARPQRPRAAFGRGSRPAPRWRHADRGGRAWITPSVHFGWFTSYRFVLIGQEANNEPTRRGSVRGVPKMNRRQEAVWRRGWARSQFPFARRHPKVLYFPNGYPCAARCRLVRRVSC
jgi:hypothetical protein